MSIRHLLTRTTLAIVLGVVLVPTSLWSSSPAAHAGTRRADVASEVAAYYHHFLGRAPDAPGLAHYLEKIGASCRTGVLHAGYAIANSGEAHAFLYSNDRKANSLYAGFLDRVPDPEGWRTQKRALDRGISWSQIVLNVQNSPEFRNRLDAVCAGAHPGERLDCSRIQGPPSASIPPDRQAWFRCQASGGPSGSSWECVEEVALTGLGVYDIARRLDPRSGAKFIGKKVGLIGWGVSVYGVFKIIRKC